MQTLDEALKDVRVGRETTWKNLAVFPLLADRQGVPDYLTLDEALAAGKAKVTEVSEGGSVPELKFVNTSDRPVFLLDGEELVGAKQNRVLNLSILAPAKATQTIPVSCVEAGRWNRQSAEFQTAGRAHYAEGRARKMAQVTRNLTKSKGSVHHADQSAVWQDIAAKSVRMEAVSQTSAMAEMYQQHEGGVEEFVKALPAQEGQIGAVFAINGHVVGLEMFDNGATFLKLMPKLIRSYALDAIDHQEEKSPSPSQAEAEAFLRQLGRAETEQFASTGLGQDTRLTGEGLAGGALHYQDRMIHLSAFRGHYATETNETQQSDGATRIVRRR